MRLGTCVAFEFVVGIGLAAGLSLAGTWGVGELRASFEREAAAATLAIQEQEAARLTDYQMISPVEPRAIVDTTLGDFTLFNGVHDDVLLGPLRSGYVTRVRVNRGGSSISLRLEFSNGARAAFKPRQTNMQTIPRREIAAFRIDRLLGLNAVPPALGRRFEMADLMSKMTARSRGYLPRIRAEVLTRNGYVSGELSWWIPVIETPRVGERWRVDGLNGIITWKRHLTIGKDIPDKDRNMVRQVSSMVLFDHVINNPDRWTGGNVKASEDGQILYFMDNTFSFGEAEIGHERSIVFLKRSQKFSRRLVRRLRELTFEDVKSVVGRDMGPFSYLLRDSEINALLSRRNYAIGYVDELIAKHGEETVLVFP